MVKGRAVKAAVIVAHPDDETIWTGGTILMHPKCCWTIVSLCRAGDPDRAPKFRRAATEFGAAGFIGDLDDGPEQNPVERMLEKTLLELLPDDAFDLVITHSPFGEYTRHRRHEETGRVICALWERGRIKADEIRLFAYADAGKGGMDDLPGPIRRAHTIIQLPQDVWQRKHHILTEIYGFGPDSYESKICRPEEAFWVFDSVTELDNWKTIEGKKNESTGSI